MVDPERVRFDERGLVPVVVQDAGTGAVLMLAYADREALTATLSTGLAHYHSRERGRLWRKGEESGHVQEVVEVRVDCDGDALLYRVRQHGPACHTGRMSCFAGPVEEEASLGAVLEGVWQTLRERRTASPENSYTARMLAAGLDRILKKIGEEAGEVILAAKNARPEEVYWEMADLWFHGLLVLLALGLEPEGLARELGRRHRPAPA